MKKAGRISIIAVFVFLTAFFPLCSLIKGESDFSVKENRALMTRPAVSFDDILDGSFQKDYDEYLSDQFIFRDFWVGANTVLFRCIGKKDVNGVFFGRDGYLAEKYVPSDFDEELYGYNIDVLSEFLNRESESNINTSCIFVPSKGTVLKNRLPHFAKEFDSGFVCTEISSLTQGNAKVLDLTSALRAHNNEYIYYKTDHHWTVKGAYYGYNEIASSFGLNRHSADYYDFKTVSRSFVGSTYDKVQRGSTRDTIIKTDVNNAHIISVDYDGDFETQKTLYQNSFLKEKNKYDFLLGGNFRQITIKTDVNNGKTLLLIKDSYSNSLIPFIAENYSKIIMIDLRYSSEPVQSLIDANRDITDLMVIYNVEKFMKDENQYLLEEQE